jgi:hypothetical protein
MRNLPIEILKEYKKGFFRKRHFFSLEFLSKTYRYTDADVPIFANLDGTARWYEPKGISFDVIPVSLDNKVSSVILTISNADHKLSDLIFGEDTRNRPCYIYLCQLDNNMDVIGTIDTFYGFADKIDPVGPEEIELQIVDHMIKWAKRTLRTHNPTCDRVFTDTVACHYVGATDVVTAIRVQADPPATTIEVDSTTGMNTVDSKISIVMDNGRKHWSRILTIPDGDTLTIRDAIPAGRYAPVDAVVETRRWCDRSRERCEEMNNTDNFGGFPWLPYLEDKQILWGREAKG